METRDASEKNRTVRIAWLEIADDADLWRRLGFVVDADGRCVVGGVEHRFVGVAAGRGVLRWVLDAAAPDQVDGLPTGSAPGHVTPPAPIHPNGVTRIDHLVIRTPSTPRTVAALTELGLERRGHRDTNSAGDQVDMTFFWVDEVLLELSGPPVPDPLQATRPSRFAGIAYASADLDATKAYLGDRMTEPRPAVQPGRHIGALRSEAGSTLAMAFMSPHRRP